ncbi:MAG TPA: MmcQ/YjbR family DNA-binding protein [Ruminococcus sp.]|nr:MmcQ/YjbR family DNA-binding protein [Ruminococcus sp.]
MADNEIFGNVLRYIKDNFCGEPEYLWLRDPDSCIVRRQDNQKWYAVFMTISSSKLGLEDSSHVRVMNLKCDPLMAGSLRCRKGIFPAYHMNKNSWITILLDGTVPEDEIFPLIQMSYGLTGGKASGNVRKSWLVPANPAYYDLEQDFRKNGMINWKQTGKVSPGDDVFIYMAASVSAVIYRCKVTESDIPCIYSDDNIKMKKIMKLKLVKRYDKDFLTREKLKEYGVSAVRGARYMPESLLELLDMPLEEDNE